MAALVLLLSPAVLRADAAIQLSVTHPILPVAQNVSQRIEIELFPATLKTEEEYKLSIASESGMGVIQLPGGPAGAGELRGKAGERLSVAYRWAGAIPTGYPAAEKITVSIPALGIANTIEFSIGVDMRITDICIPPGTESGKPQTIGLVVRDILHPDADPAALLQNAGLIPEVMIALVRDDSDAPVTPARDAFIARFSGQTAAQERETAFPGIEYKAGHLVKTGDKNYVWVSVDGRTPEFTAPSPGSYRIRASIKPGTGGVAVRETLSPSFDVTGDHAPGSDIPGFMGSTVRIVADCVPEATPRLAQDVLSALKEGREDRAALQLGTAVRKIDISSPAHILGRYVEALLESQPEDAERFSSYIQNFLKGFGGHGVLIVSRGGVASLSAVLPDKTALSSAPKKLAANVPPAARLHLGDRYVVIPFQTGKNFTVNLIGSNKGAASLWKIIPEGVNRKSYPRGDWEKEITVYGGQLLPPLE